MPRSQEQSLHPAAVPVFFHAKSLHSTIVLYASIRASKQPLPLRSHRFLHEHIKSKTACYPGSEQRQSHFQYVLIVRHTDILHPNIVHYDWISVKKLTSQICSHFLLHQRPVLSQSPISPDQSNNAHTSNLVLLSFISTLRIKA